MAASSAEERSSVQARSLAFPRTERAPGPRLLHVYVATASRSGAEPSVVFVDEHAGILDRVPLNAIASGERGPAAPPAVRRDARMAFRAMVYALWRVRRLNYRRVAVHADDPEAVAQVNGDLAVAPDAVGPYLQIRALMHLYRLASVDVGEFIAEGDAARSDDVRPDAGALSVTATPA
jgi:hypothetical protein